MISHIEAGAFVAQQNLQELSLSLNRLSNVDGVFEGLNNLRKLSLGSNQLANINHGAFDSLFSLVELRLENNSLTSLYPELFQNQPRPLELSLSSQYPSQPNNWDCNSLCWLKHEEGHGTINFLMDNNNLHPRCANAGDWGSLQCGDAGNFAKVLNQWVSTGPLCWMLQPCWATFICQAKIFSAGTCPEPGGVRFSARSKNNGPYNQGSQVTYNCFDEESGTITCQNSGRWSPGPTCPGAKYWYDLCLFAAILFSLFFCAVLVHLLTRTFESCHVKNSLRLKRQKLKLLTFLMPVNLYTHCSPQLDLWFRKRQPPHL